MDCKHPQVGPGNQDMSTAKALRSDHPEVVMFGRRCLGESAGLYVKAKAFADAGNDEMAIKVRKYRARANGVLPYRGEKVLSKVHTFTSLPV